MGDGGLGLLAIRRGAELALAIEGEASLEATAPEGAEILLFDLA